MDMKALEKAITNLQTMIHAYIDSGEAYGPLVLLLSETERKLLSDFFLLSKNDQTAETQGENLEKWDIKNIRKAKKAALN